MAYLQFFFPQPDTLIEGDGVAEELTLKTNEITRKPSDYLEGTYAAHGIEEVMNAGDVVLWVDPIQDQEQKFEDVLAKGALVRGVAVIGLPDERWGEVGCAVVALQPGAELSAEALREHCRPRLARFKQPAHVVYVDALPRNALGKVTKQELRDHAKQ